jgi:hypothetical protein
VGIKYCGGCNPEYDRVGVVEHIEKTLKDKIEIVRPESGNVDLILSINGCSTACADMEPFEGLEIHTITGIEDSSRFIKAIRGS